VHASPSFDPTHLYIDTDAIREREERAAEEARAEAELLAKVGEPIVYVRRHWSDWSVGTVRLSSINGLHMDDVSGGVMKAAPRPFLHGYILCTEIITGTPAGMGRRRTTSRCASCSATMIASSMRRFEVG
jgi:hypothetical protein